MYHSVSAVRNKTCVGWGGRGWGLGHSQIESYTSGGSVRRGKKELNVCPFLASFPTEIESTIAPKAKNTAVYT